MHAVKNILNTTKLSSINLASNMISGEGLELFLDDALALLDCERLRRLLEVRIKHRFIKIAVVLVV